jgi:probable addiction module antidote protein
MPSVSHDETMAEIYRDDPSYAVATLNSILEDEDAMPGELLIVLRQMAKAHGGVQAVAEKAELNPTQIYRTLSAEGNPSLNSLIAILRAMGMQLAVKSVEGGTAVPAASQASKRTRKKPMRVQSNALSKVKSAR